MAKQSSVNLDITNNADGFDISGGTVLRKLSITGGDITVAGSGSATLTFPTTTTTIAGTGITQSFTVLQTFNAGLSASGATFSGNIFAPNIVTSFNGLTGAVQGVSAAVAGTGISVSGATGSVTITNTGVQSFNGITGAVTGITAGGANTFTALNTFSAGISASGITVGGLITNMSTDSGSAFNPIIDLYRNSASPASSDSIGQIIFNGNDSAGNKQQYVNIHSAILDPSTTVESGQLHIETSTSGAMTEKLRIGAGGLIINNPQGNFNTTIYGQGDTMMFVAQASTDRIGIGTATPSVKLDVVGSIKASGGLSAGAGSFTGTLTGVTGNFSGLLSASSGLSAAGGVTFSGNFSGATASFSKLLSASAGVSASALTVTTTGTANKTSSISMASGVTASNSVTSQITLNAYNADSGNLPPAPYTRIGYIEANSDYDLKLRGGGDSYISILNNSISIGDIDGNFGNAKISFDTTEYVTVTGKLLPNQLVYELDEANGIPALGAEDSNPIYMKRWNSNDSPIVFTYPFYVTWSGEVQAASVTTARVDATNEIHTPYLYTTYNLYTDSVVPTAGLGGGGTLFINCDSNNTGEGGGNAITHIGDLVGDNNNTYITVDDSAGNITLNAPNGAVALSGALQYGAAGVLNNSYTLTTGATGATTVASFTKTQYRSFEFDVQGERGTTGPYQFTKILAVHDGTTVTTTQLSNISTGGTAGTYTVDISGTLVRLRVTPGATASTVFKAAVKAIPV